MNGDIESAITISICIPIYNAEAYLPRCLDSILAQDLVSFEVICVNDGSTDASWSIVEAYAAQDKRIRGINREQNCGVGVCRNIAIRAAQGEYVLAVDADDALCPDALSLLYACAVHASAEAVVGGLEAVAQNGDVLYQHIVSKKYTNVNPAEYPELYIYAMGFHQTILLNREFVLRTGVFYKEGVICSADRYFLFELFFHFSHISFITNIIYKYIQNSNSVMRSKHNFFYYVTDFGAYMYLYECAEKDNKIYVADIRFLYRLYELFFHDMHPILDNLAKEEIFSIFTSISDILNKFAALTRLFQYASQAFSWIQHPVYQVFLYEVQKGNFDIALECSKRILTERTQAVSCQQKPILEIRMTGDEREFFLRALRQAKIYIEFGSGGSTVAAVAVPSISAIYSIESDRAWLQRLQEESGIQSAIGEKRLTLIHADIGPTGEWGRPVAREGIYPNVGLYKNYFWAPWEKISRHPDLVLIDGRFRVACSLMAALMVENPKCLYLVHDYPYPGSPEGRSSYRIMEKFFDCARRVESLSLFKRKRDFDYRTALVELHNYLTLYV